MAGASFYKPSAMLDAMAGKQLPGGCQDCGAYQTVDQVEPGVYVLRVHHDASCPTYRRLVGTGRGQR